MRRTLTSAIYISGLLAAVVLWPIPLLANNYTVKSGGGGNFTTIQACAKATAAGDACTVYAGTYNETPSISTSGTGSNGVCTACITFQINPGDTVTTQPWTISASYVIIKGFTITDPTLSLGASGISLNSTTGVQILNNTVTQVGHISAGQLSSGPSCISASSSSYTTIKGNTVSWCSSLSSRMNVSGGNPTAAGGISVTGNHILVANNDISHISGHGIDVGIGSSNIVVFSNVYHDVYAGAVDAPYPNEQPLEHDSLGCIEANNCGTHVGLLYWNTINNVLFESNIVRDIWGTGGAHAFFSGGATPNSNNIIQRYNQIYHVGSSFVGGFYSSTNYWKNYNNTIVESSQQGNDTNGISICGNGGTNTSTGFSYSNNIFYETNRPKGQANRAWYTWFSECTGSVSRYNLLFDSVCSPSTLANCTTGQSLTDSGNIWADPKLVATDGSSFALQSGSPAIGVGTYLTTTTNSGSSSTTLTVADASYFQDGMGMSSMGLQPDCLRIGSSTSVCIAAGGINYNTNTITLASAASWSSGNPIYLYKDSTGTIRLIGSAPNIGAGAPTTITIPAAPSGLTAVVN